MSGRAVVSAADHGGDTALHWAACNNHPWVVLALLGLKLWTTSGTAANMGTLPPPPIAIYYNADGGTPLHAAVVNGSPDALRMLLATGADPNARFAESVPAPATFARTRHGHGGTMSRDTALHVAAADGRLPCADALLRAGAAIDAINGRRYQSRL
jgi:ankyrin repeat protein